MSNVYKQWRHKIQISRCVASKKDGVEKAIVTFNQETSSFELVDVETNQTFQFDDIDLVTIEILKCYKIKIITVSKATAQSVCAVAFQYIR